jgi:hypothetical protein
MRLVGWTCALLLLAATVTTVRAVDGSDPAEVDGVWVVTQDYRPSQINEQIGALGPSVQILNGTMSAVGAQPGDPYISLSFDPSQSPQTVDITIPGDTSVTLLGIYQVVDGVMTITVGTSDTRPQTFDDNETQVTVLFNPPVTQ